MALNECKRNAASALTGPVPNSKQLGVAIRERRDDQRLTVEELATEAGVDTSYLSGIERLGRNPSWSKLTKIFAALKIDASQLIERAEQIALSEQSSAGHRARRPPPAPEGPRPDRRRLRPLHHGAHPPRRTGPSLGLPPA